MEVLNFFDSNCSFGMRRVVNPGSFYKLSDLVEKMEYYGINKALVYHSMAREYNPEIGNSMLMNEIRDNTSLYPVWTVMHHHTEEFPEPDKLMQQLKGNNVKAVCMFPTGADQGYSLSEWNCGELFSALEKHCVPLLLSMDQLTWNELHDILSCHPDLKFILTGVSYRINRNLYALLKKFENLYVETSGYKITDGIEDVCRKFGAHRLIFGSGMPVLSGSAAVGLINYAKISDKEKRMIASENLEALLGGVKL